MKELLFSKEQCGVKINFYTNQQGTLFTTVTQVGQEDQPVFIRGLSKTENLTEQDKQKLKEDIVKYDLQLRGSEIYVRELLFSRKKSDIEFSFYTNQVGTLFATVAQTGQKEQAASIKGLSKTKNLTEQDKEELKQIIPQYDLQFRGFDVIAKHEQDKGLLGGWNEDVHLVDTEKWIKEYFGEFFTNHEAKIISQACNLVDLEFHPILWQSWHFNVNAEVYGGDYNDSRIEHIRKCLLSAITQFQQTYIEKSLVILGYGLHALQDIFAHADEFVVKKTILSKTIYSHAIPGNMADHKFRSDTNRSDIQYNQRYLDTMVATHLYLSIFNLLRNGYDPILLTNDWNQKLIKSLQEQFDSSNKYMFRGFLKTIIEVLEEKCHPKNSHLAPYNDSSDIEYNTCNCLFYTPKLNINAEKKKYNRSNYDHNLIALLTTLEKCLNNANNDLTKKEQNGSLKGVEETLKSFHAFITDAQNYNKEYKLHKDNAHSSKFSEYLEIMAQRLDMKLSNQPIGLRIENTEHMKSMTDPKANESDTVDADGTPCYLNTLYQHWELRRSDDSAQNINFVNDKHSQPVLKTYMRR